MQKSNEIFQFCFQQKSKPVNPSSPLSSPTSASGPGRPLGLAGPKPLFSSKTKAIVWGMQTRAVQSMLDFDFVCQRTEPSVAAMVYPFTGDHKLKFYWGHKEVLIPGMIL